MEGRRWKKEEEKEGGRGEEEEEEEEECSEEIRLSMLGVLVPHPPAPLSEFDAFV